MKGITAVPGKNTQTDTGKGSTRCEAGVGGGDTNRTEVSFTKLVCCVCTGKAGWCVFSWPSLSG